MNFQEILDSLKDSYDSQPVNSKTEKSVQIKAAISEVLSECRQHDRFPPIRHISERLEIAMVHVQKAITELIAENRLYSRNRVGLFVKTPVPLSGRYDEIHRKEPINILFPDKSELMKQVMVDVMEAARNNLSLNQGQLFFEEAEGIDYGVLIQDDTPEETMELAENFRDWVNGGSIRLDDAKHAPMFYQTVYLMYDREILQKHNVPEPNYQTFAGQMIYFQELRNKLPRRVGLWVEPHWLLGGTAVAVVGQLVGEEASAWQEPVKQVMQLAEYLELERTVSFLQEFKEKNLPCLLIRSTSAMELIGRREKDFSCCFYPFLAPDDLPVLDPAGMKIKTGLKYFYDGFKVLLALQGTAAQEILRNAGHVTAQRKCRFAGRSLQKHFEKAVPILFDSEVKRYLFKTILSSEIFITAFNRKEQANALLNIEKFAKATIRYTELCST